MPSIMIEIDGIIDGGFHLNFKIGKVLHDHIASHSLHTIFNQGIQWKRAMNKLSWK